MENFSKTQMFLWVLFCYCFSRSCNRTMRFFPFLCLVLLCTATKYHVEYNRDANKYSLSHVHISLFFAGTPSLSTKPHSTRMLPRSASVITSTASAGLPSRSSQTPNLTIPNKPTLLGMIAVLFLTLSSHNSYGEGYATAARIQQHYNNIYSINFGNRTVPNELRQFLQKQLAWMQSMVCISPFRPLTRLVSHDPYEDYYWYNINLVLKQLEGMTDGYVLLPPLDR